jgi:hypothetical protein
MPHMHYRIHCSFDSILCFDLDFDFNMDAVWCSIG